MQVWQWFFMQVVRVLYDPFEVLVILSFANYTLPHRSHVLPLPVTTKQQLCAGQQERTRCHLGPRHSLGP